MLESSDGNVTELLSLWTQGDEAARDELWSAVYNELRRLGGELMNGERRNHTLQPTALVNEAFLKMLELKRIRYRDRQHFFAMAARMMRRILVDHAREKGARKRDWGERVTVELPQLGISPPAIDLLDLDRALDRLEEMEPENALAVELRFFGGLTNEEVANVLGCSERTVGRHWRVARLWLYREISGDEPDAT